MSNVALGDLVKMYDSRDNLVVQTNNKVVILNGIKKLFVVDTEDALVVSKLDREQSSDKLLMI